METAQANKPVNVLLFRAACIAVESSTVMSAVTPILPHWATNEDAISCWAGSVPLIVIFTLNPLGYPADASNAFALSGL